MAVAGHSGPVARAVHDRCLLCRTMELSQRHQDKPETKEAQIQKDEPIVHSGLRDLLQQEKYRAEEALRAARESRSALNLQIDEVQQLRGLITGSRWSSTPPCVPSRGPLSHQGPPPVGITRHATLWSR